MKYYIDLDSMCEDIFHAMEDIQDGIESHTVMFEANDIEDLSLIIAERLIPFWTEQVEV